MHKRNGEDLRFSPDPREAKRTKENSRRDRPAPFVTSRTGLDLAILLLPNRF
jgi:hypothetical protein